MGGIVVKRFDGPARGVMAIVTSECWKLTNRSLVAKSDLQGPSVDVGYWGKSRPDADVAACPLMTKSGRSGCKPLI
jgi:hypothetical protein